MSQEPTLRQRVNAAIQAINEVRQRIAVKTAELDVLEAEYRQRRDDLKVILTDVSPALAQELFSGW